MAVRSQKSLPVLGSVLGISHLNEVIQVLKNHHFPNSHYYLLGLSLGLYDDTLRKIEEEHKNDVNRRMSECLRAWLYKADNVQSKGDPSYYTLIVALRSLRVHAVADGIGREKHPACVILARHQSDVIGSLQDSLPSLVILLRKERLISEMALLQKDMMTEIQNAVFSRPENLEKFAAVLKLFPTTISVGDAILKDYRIEFPDDSTVETISIDGEEKSIEIRIPRSMTPEFKTIRNQWAEMFLEVYKVVTVSTKKLKLYLKMRRSDLKPQLANSCKSREKILQLISEECSLIDVSLLEGMVDYFKLEKAKEHINEYKKSIEEFCKKIPLRQCLDEKLSILSSPLQCETITFVVDRSVDDCTLQDIDDLVTIAFENNPAVKVINVKRSNSFTITCFFSLTQSVSLIRCASKNLQGLKKRGLQHLTIGYSTIYSHEVKEIIEENGTFFVKRSTVFSDWGTIPTNRGILEQMESQVIVAMDQKHKEELENLREILPAKRQVIEIGADKDEESPQEDMEYQSTQEHEDELITLKKDLLTAKKQAEKSRVKEDDMNILLARLERDKILLQEQLAQKELASKEEVTKLEEMVTLLTGQLAMFTSEKDADKKDDSVSHDDISSQSVKEKEDVDISATSKMGCTPMPAEGHKPDVVVNEKEVLHAIQEDFTQLLAAAKLSQEKELRENLTGFKDLFQRFLKEKESRVDWAKVSPPPEKSIKEYAALGTSVDRSTARRLLEKLVVVKLNGGLGTSMGCVGPKCLIKVRGDATFLDVTVQQIERLNQEYGSDVPLVLMNSFNTNTEINEIKHKFEKRVKLYLFDQSYYPCIGQDTYRPVPKKSDFKDGEWYPPGHGDVYFSLKKSGRLQQFMDEGKEIMFLSNIDNLGATVDLSILDHLLNQSRDCEFAMEVTHRTQADLKGGVLVQYENKLQLLEIPSDKVDKFAHFKVFNTNNLWVRLPAIDSLLSENKLTMDIIVNRKTINNGLDVIQLETAAGAAIKCFDNAIGINVLRSRFLPVKTTSDLVMVMSNLFTLVDGHLILNEERKTISLLPTIMLGSQHFRTVQDVLKRFKSIPDMVDLDALTVSGDVTFGKDVVLKGNVIILAYPEHHIDIPAGASYRNQIISSQLRILEL